MCWWGSEEEGREVVIWSVEKRNRERESYPRVRAWWRAIIILPTTSKNDLRHERKT